MLTEYAVLLLVALGGVAIAWQLGIRNMWLGIPSGLMISVVLRDVLFATMNMVNQRWLSAFTFFGILALGLIVSAWQAGKGLYKSMILAASMAIAAVTATRVFGFQGTPHGDSLWILSFVRLFDVNGNIALLNGHTAIKRGFSYPLMLALGPSGQYLSGLTPYIYGALASLVIWVVLQLTKNEARKRVLWVSGLLFLATFSTVMPIRSIFYINGHTLTAVGMLAAAGAVTLAVRDYELTREHLMVICLGVFTASTSRIEGIVLCALIVLPLISQHWIRRSAIMWIVGSGTFGISLWLATYHSYIINATHLPWYIFMALLVGGGSLIAVKWLDWLRLRLVPIALISMGLVFVGAQIVFHTALAKGYRSIVTNLIFGSGRWGIFVAAIILGIALGRLRKLTPEHKTLLTITLSLILGSLITKMLDGGQFGHPTLGRVGWSDSLNRMWLQSFAIFLVTVLVGLVQNNSIWGADQKSKG
jgi:hypothetical protein